MIWDESLIQEVAERRAIFVLGAGASMACKTADGTRPPSWIDLLKNLNQSVTDDAERKYADDLIDSERLLEAAEVIRMNINPAEFSRIIKDKLKKPDYIPSDIHTTIMEIDPKIVITTNYDEIYEKLFHKNSISDGYSVAKPDDRKNIIDNIRSGERCVIKMHGCVTSPLDIVLNKTSYFAARRSYPNFFRAIDALFLVNTLIFVGSSLDDPDLQLVLENSLIAAPSMHQHFAILELRKHESQRKILGENFNIKTMEYPIGEHQHVAMFLEEMRDRVIEWRENHD